MVEYADVNTFMQWAAELSSEIAWKEEERPYKIAFANKLAGIRQELADGEPGWYDGLLKASADANLLNWRFLGNLRITTAAGHREELKAAVARLWKNDASPAALTPFVEEFRALNAEFAPGNVLAFGSVLLMAVDPTVFPPYRAESGTRFLKLLGASAVPSNRAPAAERYEAFLAGLDALLETAAGSRLNLADRLDAQGLVWLVTNYSPPEAWSPARKREFLAWRNQETILNDEADLRQGPYPVLERAAAAILTPGIAGRPSPFDPAVVSWTEANARELYRRVHVNYDAGSGTFMGKLEKQLAGADRGVVLLTAELLALQCLPLVNLKPDTKIARVSTVLSWLEEVPDIPEVLKAGLLGTGAFHGGTGFNQQQWRHLCWLAELVASLRSSEDTAARAAASPQGFHDVAEAIPGNLPSIRYSMEYLSWPGFFEPIVSWGHRKKIRNAFAHEIEGSSGDDEYSIAKDLCLIRKTQEARTGTHVEWYEEPYVSQWRPAAERAPRAWLVRQSQSGLSLAGQWVEDCVVTLEAQHLDSVDADAGLTELQAAVDAGYSHLDYSERRLRARSYHLFLSQMRPDDLVVTVVGGSLKPGVIAGDPAYERDGDTAVLTCDVAWQDIDVPTEDLSAPFPRLLEEQGTVIDMTEALPQIRRWVDVEPVDVEPLVVPHPAAGGVPKLREASDELANKLFVGREELREIIGLLQSRNQIVFYGPPGTGKTFLAGRLARYLAGEEHPNHVTTVQFHPSYAYEDFFEGYRPVKGSDGQVGFALVSGPLRRIAGAAAAERDKPFFLIIDEMNRGNLAKVFGELYFLLEYRDQSIDLQYNSDETFVLPPNLFIIGTMNTADRSIATVDAAIRRRFAFVELHPQNGMTKGVLDRFLAAKSRDARPARLLEALNQEIDVEKRDLMIGPSYFMTPESETRAGLERIWKYELLPLLEEHYYGALSREDLHARFGLEAIERRIDGTPTADW